ncbi:hypothetical protein C5708_01355 [Caulobacter sp. CCUG 60055]|uniref:hypothetical protein n=1 Tax=Caulobacter sp. CCUG 60055 TaxID=2100090 RepID=UPI001FA787E2|nr:hypothetical protein [Caulobacter sp. CCUG 60055]MBQ1540652.1 hypothetical protein [Caulobacteraceae bacterium]MCI3178895.1 hypothetical protein [Caulobacter sp. CCUG 60055]
MMPMLALVRVERPRRRPVRLWLPLFLLWLLLAPLALLAAPLLIALALLGIFGPLLVAAGVWSVVSASRGALLTVHTGADSFSLRLL